MMVRTYRDLQKRKVNEFPGVAAVLADNKGQLWAIGVIMTQW